MRSEQIIDFSGFLDKDTAPEKIANGNYTEARNIQPITGSTESTQNHIPMLGNVEAFNLGSVTTQNKTWRVYLTQLAAPFPFGNIQIFDTNGVQVGVTLAWGSSVNMAGQAAAIRAQIIIAGIDVSPTVTSSGTTSGYVDITLTLITGYDWSLSAFLTGPTTLTTAIVKEAYDTTLAGELKVIGSYDLLGDLYVWSTTGSNLPAIQTNSNNTVAEDFAVISISTVIVGTKVWYRIIFSTPHGLTAGQSAALKANTILPIDGTWIISATGLTTHAILLESYQNAAAFIMPASTTIQITLYNNSIGEIGVAQFAPTTDTWTYTRLGRTKQWGFRTKKQPDTYCEQTSVKASIYWTDDFNVPRCVYYIKEYDVNNTLLPFDADGLITALNSAGEYSYDTIEIESRLQLTDSAAELAFVRQLQSGGEVVSGNWRYAYRLLTENLVATAPSSITNPINVYVADVNGRPDSIIGDQAETITSKINEFTLTGILPGLFKYVELIGINYLGNAIAGYMIIRQTLSDTQTSINLSHTGSETETSNFDLGLLNQITEIIATAKNIAVIDKRMILSNLTTRQKEDFTNWAQTLQHSVGRQSLTAVRSAIGLTLVMGEYQNPQNVYNYLGYMHNETIRFGVELRLKGAGWSEAFHVDDITINCNATTASGRRLSGLADFNLTGNTLGGADDVLFSAYVSFAIGATQLDYLIDGKRFRDLVDGIRFVRAEVVPTILACGVGIVGVSAVATNNAALDESGFLPSGGADLYEISPDSLFLSGSNPNKVIEYPFASGRTNSAVIGSNPQYLAAAPLTPGGEWTQRRNWAAFYSPDITFGHTAITFASGDSIINFGSPHVTFNNTISIDAARAYSNYAEYTGRTNKDSALATDPDTVVLTTASAVGKGSNFTSGSQTFYKLAHIRTTGPLTGTYDNPEGMVLVGATDFNAPPGYVTPNDYGLYYMQYSRPLTNQYGATASTQYISTGHFLEITSSFVSSTEVVFGGDTFTQFNYFRHRLAETISTGLGGGLGFYCQNKINAQMKMKELGTSTGLYPVISTAAWLDTQALANEEYQEGYTARNDVQSRVAFDPDLEDNTDFPARIRWSGIKPQGSSGDPYRVYQPLNFHDLDQSFGEIMHQANGNGELLTWQQRAFMRQFFNARGTLEVKGISEVLIGDGSVMSRDGVTVSRLGSKHKWAICKGKSTGGNDVFYWLNTELKKALRFGYDGTVSIADIKGMQSFLANNLKWVDTKDTPADGTGICCVWDDRYANVIWTVVGDNSTVSIADWSNAAGYTQNVKVFYPTDPFLGKQFTYNSFTNVVNTNNQPDTSPLWWVLVPNDGTYFNKYTLIFNEFKNAFICDATPTPKIYLKWTDTFLSPRPISTESKVYQANRGKYLWWYEESGVKQTDRAYIEGVVNGQLIETKTFEAVGVDSQVAPIRMEFTTKGQESFLIQSEFTTREDSSFAPIKRDSTTTGINSGDTSPLYGKWLKVKTFFEIDTYQFLSNITVKFGFRPRLKSK